MDSAQWRGVDGTDDAGFFVAYLDRAAASLRAARLEAIRALDVPAGAAVLDVGCGVGEFLIELAGSLPGVRAVGIDASAELTATAQHRAAAAGVAADIKVGDAEHLDLPDQAFDRVNCSRVLVHLDDPGAAVREMARVLRDGGRLAIWEPDFDALIIDSDDLATAAAVRAHLIAGLRNPDIGRRLRRLVLDAGLAVIDVLGIARPVRSLRHAADQFHLFSHLDAAVAAGDVSHDAAAAWRAWLEAADSRGQLFVSPVGFRVLAEKAT
jgi:SAM-dependent methyltransferase